MGLLCRGLSAKKLTYSPLQALIGKVSVDVWAYRNSMVLNKLSKAARGKTNKAYDNTASFSKILTSKKPLSEIFNTEVTNTFILIQIQREISHIKCFYLIVSEECCYLGSDWDTTVWCCFC